MNNLLRIAVTSIVLILCAFSSAIAQDEPWECINSNSKASYLKKQWQEAIQTSSISQLLYKDPILGKEAKAEADALLAKPCAACLAGPLKTPTESMTSLNKFVLSGSGINLGCIKAARSFSTATTEVQCPENKEKSAPAILEISGKKKKVIEASGACVTLPMLDYQRQVFENFYRCIRKYSTAPFNPATIFEIVSRESTFKPNYSSSAGHGSGQLTSDFINDVQQEGRGRTTLKALALDATPECAAAQKLAEGDLSKKLSLPKDRCQFIQYGSGMERNALWMMIGLDTTWRRNLAPNYKQYISKYKDHPDLSRVMEKMLQLSYGRAGYKGMYAVMSRLSRFPPDRVLKELQNHMPLSTENPQTESLTAYLNEIADRQNKIVSYIDDPNFKVQFAKKGASACIQ